MKKEKLAILVCCHKADENIRNYPPYKAIQVGAALHPEMDLGFMKDNVGDNISEKNMLYNELCAIYWAWKNMKDVEYVGLNHYRRYFDIDLSDDNIDKYMRGCDIVIGKRIKKFDFQLHKNSMMYATSQEDFYIFMDTMLKMRPQYKDRIIDYFYNDNEWTPCTMFITRKEILDDFCEFLFPVLEELEKRIPRHPYSRQNRFIAYFGELSLGLYIYCKQLKKKKVPLVMLGEVNHTPTVEKAGIKLLINNFMCFAKKIYRKIFGIHDGLFVPDDVLAGFRNDGITLDGINTAMNAKK